MTTESVPRSGWASFFWSRRAPLALAVIVATVAVDQLHKWWMLSVYDIAGKGRVEVFPFLDLVYVKNIGISYSLFNQESVLGQYLLMAVCSIREHMSVDMAQSRACRQADGDQAWH